MGTLEPGLVSREALEILWVELLARYPEPLAQADMIARETIEDMRRSFSERLDGDDEAHAAAVAEMEDIWRSIRSKLVFRL